MQRAADDQLQQAIEDIKEWLRDNDGESFVDRLAPGASEATIAAVEAELGVPLPAGLCQLYRAHDGQTGEVEPLFEHMFFLDLEAAVGLRWGMLQSYVIPPDGLGLREYHRRHDYVTDEELLSPRWLPFANTEGDFLAVQLDSGRVFRFCKGDLPWIRLEAEDFATFVGDYASALWDDVYQFHGDLRQPGVVEDGLRWLGRYLSRS